MNTAAPGLTRFFFLCPFLVSVRIRLIREIRGCSSVLVLLLFCGSALFAQAPTYWQDVRPALRKHCIACHNARNVKEVDVSGGLALDSVDFMKSKKPVVIPGKSGDSEVLKRVLSKDDNTRMPPGDVRLPDETVTLLRRWIDGGALEGKKPEDTGTVITTRPIKRRKLPVTLATSALPPAGILDTGKPDKLSLTLRVGPLAPVTAVAFSPDGKLLAAGSYGRVCIWDTATARPIRTLTNVLGSVNDLKFSPDGSLLVVAGGQPSAQGDLRLFEVNGWKLKTALRGHEDVVACVAFRPDGKKLATASFDRSVRIWDMAGLKCEATLDGHSDFVYAVAYSPDGKLLASASKDRTVKLVDADSRAGKLTFSGMSLDVLAVAFNHDGTKVISSGYEPALSWWSTKTAEREKSSPGHRGAVHEIAVSRDGKTIASAGGDGSVILWDGASGTNIRTLTAGSLVYSVALAPDVRLVAAGCYDGLVRVFDVKTGRHLVTLLEMPGQAEGDWLALTPEGYVAGNKALAESAEWRMANRVVPSAGVWKALGKDDQVAAALRGQALSPPVFTK